MKKPMGLEGQCSCADGWVADSRTGTVVTQTGERDDDHKQRNPFERILDKLDKITRCLKSEGGARGESHAAVGSGPAGGAAVRHFAGLQQRRGAGQEHRPGPRWYSGAPDWLGLGLFPVRTLWKS